jgi:hypothetical protein
MDAIEEVLTLRAPLTGGTGFVGPDIPVDLLLATARPFGHLPWSDAPTPWADRWLESSFPFWARSILEQWHAGSFDGLEHVVFSRSDDVSQRLYYYVRELQTRELLSGPAPLVLDVALIRRDSSLAHTAAAIRECAAALDVSAAALAAAVPRANALRSRLTQIQNSRQADGPYYERLSRAVLFSDATAWLDAVRPRATFARPRLLLAGSVPPDDRLHRAVEASGASIVAEHHVYALSRLGPPLVLEHDDVAAALARHLVANSIGPRSFIDRPATIVAAARAEAVRGVVLWQTREEEGLAWHIPAQRRALEAAGIPALVIAAGDWRASGGTLEAIQQFCEELER